MNILYLKHHGLPGIPLYKGENGLDGNNGNNIYFGYVSDFFNNVEISIDNFIRTALRSANTYYTGIYKQKDSSIISDNIISSYKNTRRYPDNATDISTNVTVYNSDKTYTTLDVSGYTDAVYEYEVTDSNNYFSFIYDEPMNQDKSYLDYYKYSYKKYSYDDDSELSSSSQTYVKVDSGDGNISGFNADEDETGKWWGEYNASNRDTDSWPYTKFYGTVDSGDAVDIMSGKSSITKIDGFELFTTADSNNKYVYKSDNERYNDFRYNSYNDNNKTLFNGSTTDYIDDNGERMRTTYLEYLMYQYSNIDPYYTNSVNYIKYSHNAIDSVMITDTLKSNIKCGDIIYFYKDPETFKFEHTVEYMVVITKDLENCTIDDLIASAVLTEPFTFKYIDTTTIKGNDFLSTQSNVCSVFYNDDNSNIELCGKNLCNLLTYSSTSAFNAGNISDDNTSYNKTLQLSANDYDLSFKTRVESSTEKITNIIDSDSDSKIKVSNAYAKKYNIGNIETTKCLSPDNIILDSTFHCYTISENNYDYLRNTITIDKTDLVDDESFDDYDCGVIDIVFDYELYSETSSFINGDNCNIYKYTFISHDEMCFSLNKDFGNTTAHNILFWISTLDGMKYYSNHSIIKYDYSIRNYTFGVIESDNTVLDEVSSDDDVLVYTPSGISADKVSNGSLTIELPNTASNIQLFINSSEISLNNTYSNDWCVLTYSNIENSIEDGVQNNSESTKITLKISMEDNIPQMTSYYNCSSAREYISSPGLITDITTGCDLFNLLLTDSAISTKDRYVTITVKYDYQKNAVSHSAKSFYKLTQPGYIEKRQIPKIDINIEQDLNSLEMANNIDNGVLCNQFQFFMDVNISDFDKECWSSYVNEENILLNLEIKNVPVDYDTVEKYAIQSAESMYTYHAFTKDVDNDFNNNYLKMNIYPVDASINDPYNTTQKDLYTNITYNSNDKITTKYTYDNIEVQQQFSTEQIMKNSNTIELKKSLFNNNNPEEASIGSGINDSITISINNIKFSDVENGKIRFKVFVEVGNPIFSKLFFRFYVSNMSISYTDNDTTSIFYIGTNNLAEISQTGKYQTYNYMYASDTFNAFICPLSLTAIYDDVDKVTYKLNKIYGSDDLIQLTLNTYLPEISEKTDTQKIEILINKQFIDWFNFDLKKKYLQDNVKSFYVQPIHISDYYDKISDDDLFVSLNKNRETAYNSVKSETISDSYMSIVYNAYSYYQKTIYDTPQFYYNDELYHSSKYNQLKNNSPVFVEQSLSYDVRDALLINSMDEWNYQYKQLYSNNSLGAFTGHINSYGNGYQYVSSSYDIEESTDTQLTLAETVELNEYSFFDAPYTQNIAQLSKTSENNPNLGKWYRTLLWQVKWQYGKYYTDAVTQEQKVDAYDIVDSGNYYNYYDSENNKYMIPHNLTYSLYPRCAYNNDNQTNIIFMLRCPTISQENQHCMKYQNIKFTVDRDSYNNNQIGNDNLTSLL